MLLYNIIIELDVLNSNLYTVIRHFLRKLHAETCFILCTLLNKESSISDLKTSQTKLSAQLKIGIIFI